MRGKKIPVPCDALALVQGGVKRADDVMSR